VFRVLALRVFRIRESPWSRLRYRLSTLYRTRLDTRRARRLYSASMSRGYWLNRRGVRGTCTSRNKSERLLVP
jgi:hypothetical protein